jgi:hypothetical protein
MEWFHLTQDRRLVVRSREHDDYGSGVVRT